ncbi:tRNA (N(6)-L-threonylcarbamoyladenosine(37)-C(2))-methylthiotransferase MtaB [Anaerocellum diazotrophicum]|uniref:tRNA (N(6)-L-threonylcarbamoyladenosine(37)-C(2))-methylthiotransferase n=1 Tax=Caldicellulosiruptor diazotrophicus TaxID=2806205 RepID=A0ABM7NMB6_9FIRM|nr:tRNA (N(6)-L-threonylcarbamoyladenosine(37)-C(2))-methylthiotransferase MtaB [Caldicellulosiruptor diazotrophicus]BCS81265.1 tRNA (N(6)-L-threonylcarbamoyladenosine(37)-C(2))-methylthiotran sferase MtaB [Caldicellulosiruptor diazotrophicus]
MKVAFYTLGCKVNQYETQAVAELFKKIGFEIVDFESKADVYVINTCTVTNASDRKSRQVIKKARKLSPQSIVVVMGCYPQVYPHEVEKIKDIDIIIGTKDRQKIVDYIKEYLENKKKIVAIDEGYKREAFEELKISEFNERSRAFIKIEEGCEQFCSYCIIPYARGAVRSRSLKSIEEEVIRLVKRGYKEFVITGINISSYGKDLNGNVTLIDVIDRVNKIEGVKRIRLSSLEPVIMNDEFIERLLSFDKLCHHLHLSLQSGSDKILKLMNRHYTTAQYQGIVDRIREEWEDVAFTTDIIVGFPGETEEDFNATLEFVQKIGFSRIHVFRFSPKKGTKAFEMPNHVDNKEKERRSKIMKEVAERLSYQFHSKFVGKTLEVLIERDSDFDGYYEGYSGNYIRTLVRKTHTIIPGEIYKVKIIQAFEQYVKGEIIQ